MGTQIEDLAAKVAAETTIDASVIALLTDLSSRLKSAQASGDPAQLTSIINQIDANNAALAAAVTANTVPVAPAPTASGVTATPPTASTVTTSAVATAPAASDSGSSKS